MTADDPTAATLAPFTAAHVLPTLMQIGTLGDYPCYVIAWAQNMTNIVGSDDYDIRTSRSTGCPAITTAAR
jgi:hypothetical protein